MNRHLVMAGLYAVVLVFFLAFEDPTRHVGEAFWAGASASGAWVHFWAWVAER